MASYTEKLSAQWQHAVNVLLGVWLVVSPWALGYTDNIAAAWNASVIGFVIALAGASAVAGYHEPRAHSAGERGLETVGPAEEWVTAVLAAWLIVSPYVLGFGTTRAVGWNYFVVGVLVAVLALWAAIAARPTDGAASRG